MFQMPDDITLLSPEELDQLLADAVAAFDEASGADTVTADDLENLRGLRGHIDTIRAEQNARTAAAEEAAAEIDALRNAVHGESEAEVTESEAEAEVTEPPADAELEAPEAELEAGELETVTAGARPLNIRAIRERQPRRPIPEDVAIERPGVTITAAADVPGLSAGQGIDIDALTQGVIARASGLKAGKLPGTALVASYAAHFDDDLIVTDAGSVAQGTSVTLAAADQSRLPQGDLVASGGWCAPSETIYTIADVACPEMLWTAPEVQLARGGARWFKTPTLDIGDLTWVHTEADDIAGETKPVFAIPCPEPSEVRCDAVGVILEAGILTERHFPELVSWYVRNSMVAHEIRIAQQMFLGVIAKSSSHVVEETFGAFTAVYAQVALQAADLIERHSLCESTAVEVVFPFWARNLFLADIARQNGRAIEDVNPAIISGAFASLGVSMQYARSLPPAVPNEIGGSEAATAWPETVPFVMYPAGSFEIGRGAEVNLGAVYDSNKFVTNDYTALFTEECVALLDRGPESRFVTVPVCADGATGRQLTDVDCPIDVSTVGS